MKRQIVILVRSHQEYRESHGCLERIPFSLIVTEVGVQKEDFLPHLRLQAQDQEPAFGRTARTASGPDLLFPTTELMTLPASSERGRRCLGSDGVWMCPCIESNKRRKPLLMSHVASS